MPSPAQSESTSINTPTKQSTVVHSTPTNNANKEPSNFDVSSPHSPVLDTKDEEDIKKKHAETSVPRDENNISAKEKSKQERKATKKLIKELAVCKTVLEELEVHFEVFLHRNWKYFKLLKFFSQVHEDSWPFLLPVNTKQFPTYKKIIKCPMDLSTIKKRLQDLT